MTFLLCLNSCYSGCDNWFGGHRLFGLGMLWSGLPAKVSQFTSLVFFYFYRYMFYVSLIT